jgi:uncharacterized protein (TIGR02145 family)
MKKVLIFIICYIYYLSVTLIAQEFNVDANTTLLLHLNDNLNGAQGELPNTYIGINYSPGIFNNGCFFSNSNDVKYPSLDNIDPLQGSLEFWINPNWNGDDGNDHYVLRYGYAGGMLIGKDGANSWRILFNRWGPPGFPEVGAYVNVSGEWTAGIWHHAAFTWGFDKIQIFIDGQLRAENPVTDLLFYVMDTDFQLGSIDPFYGGADAVIDELRISNIVRTPEEIYNSYLAGYAGLQSKFDLKVFLEGPFNGAEMTNNLNTTGLLPLSQPYNSSPWNYNGTEAVAAIPNADISDWVLVELRETTGNASTATPDKIINRQAAFLKKNGNIVGLNGDSLITYSGNISNNLYVVIWHRNHLAVMSSGSLTKINGTYTWDFTDLQSKAYLEGQKYISYGKFGMIGGDCNADGRVNILDKNENWEQEAGDAGYYSCDANMDAQVNNLDKDEIWIPNKNQKLKLPEGLNYNCGDFLVDERDDEVYSTVKIGSQCWMAENLNTGIMINGGSNQSDNSAIEKYCYNNATSNCDIYGGLYQWNEMMHYITTEGIQGICPEGWHLPANSEWELIRTYLGGELVAGGKMKEIGTAHWNPPNVGATNESGFTALPAGYRNINGNFMTIGSDGQFWSSSNFSSNNALKWQLGFDSPGFGTNNDDKNFGLSVRCLNNTPVNQPPSVPFNLQPPDESYNRAKTTVWSWSCTDPDNDQLTFDVYSGWDPNSMTLVANDISQNFYTKYWHWASGTGYTYWQVIARDSHNNETAGPIIKQWLECFGEIVELLSPEDKQQYAPFKLFWHHNNEGNFWDIYRAIYFGDTNPPPLYEEGNFLPSSNDDVCLSYDFLDTSQFVGPVFYWKMIVNNYSGTGYHETPVQSFSRFFTPCEGIHTLTYEGQTYNTVQIGNQCWMHENLNVGTMIDGSNNQQDNSIIEKYCYNNDEAECATYGGLYQWHEIAEYNSNPYQGICPPGWHIPSDDEWCTLETFVDPVVALNCNDQTVGFRGADVGVKLRANGSNSSGFSALVGGVRAAGGGFLKHNEMGVYWSRTPSILGGGWYWSRTFDVTQNQDFRAGELWQSGYSVRCLKN